MHQPTSGVHSEEDASILIEVCNLKNWPLCAKQALRLDQPLPSLMAQVPGSSPA